MNHNQIIEAWNAQSDVQNQWYVLGEDEKVEFAFSVGSAESKAEIERLKSTPPEEREDLHCVIADLARQCQESDALLRQALEAMQWEVGGEPLPTLMMESIDAIKQHLGEV